MTDLVEKTNQYEELLAEALAVAEPAVAPETPLAAAVSEYLEVAEAYLDDGRHFQAADDFVNALAAFAYGHAWLDAGARLGLLAVPADSDLFAV